MAGQVGGATENTTRSKTFSPRQKVVIVLSTIALIALLSLMPQGPGEGKLHGEGRLDPDTGEFVFVETTGWTASTALWTGAIAGYILLISPLTGHRPLLRRWLKGAAWRRVHVTVGLLILLFAAVHAIALIAMQAFHTWPSGAAALVVLSLHGASAAFKQRLVAHWGKARWRTIHIATGWVGLTIGLQHALGMNALAGLLQHM